MKLKTLLFICLLFAGVSAQDTSTKGSTHEVSELGWMSGCWAKSGKNVDSFTSENWTKPFGMMIGTNRTVREGKVVAFEYLRIETREDGIFYVAKPSGAPGETSFKLATLDMKKVVFENEDHDFPKRIIYSMSENSELTARVEDDSKGFNFSFKKVSCDE